MVLMSTLHKKMIDRIMNAPINLYFEVTPVGRILNRFSKDIQVLDSLLFWMVAVQITNIFQLVAILVVCLVVVPWIILAVPFLFAAALYMYSVYIHGFKEANRIESVTKSPIISQLGETVSGQSTIRAFGKTAEFIRENNKLLN